MGRSTGLLSLILATSMLTGLTSTLAWAQTSQIKHVRVGGHKTYDRLVVELSGPAKVSWGTQADPKELVFEIAAKPLLPQTLATGLRRLGTFRVEKTPEGTRIRLESKPRRTRVFRLTRPERIVIDLADPSSKPFVAPRGTQAIAQKGTPTVVAKAPPKAAAKPAAKPAAEPAAKPVAKAETKPAPKTERERRRSPFAPPTGELIDRALVSKATPPSPEPVKPAAKPPTPETKRPASARAGAPTSRPTPVERPAKTTVPVPAAGESPLSKGQGIWIAMIALGVMGALGIGFWVWNSQKGGDPAVQRPDTVRGSPVIITQDELRDGPRVELLDKRLDEEVRARMQLEERMQQANEEIKVLRDRLARIERRRGA